MNIKNAVYKDQGNTIIDVEIEHPKYGWIPYTFKSDEADQGFDAEIRLYLETASIAGYVALVISVEQELIKERLVHKDMLRKDLIDKMLEPQFAAIDEASDVASVKAVGLD